MTMVAMCAATWLFLAMFMIDAGMFEGTPEDRNTYRVIFLLSFAVLPVYFGFGL